MKNGIVWALALALSMFMNPVDVLAQRSGCAIDTTNCSGPFGAICPDTLLDAQAGGFYFDDLTFNMPATIVVEEFALPQPITIPIINITLDTLSLGRPTTFVVANAQLQDVLGLPTGIDWECNSAGTSCTYFPDSTDLASQFGCVEFFSSVCDTAGEYTIAFNFLYTLDITDLDLSSLPSPLDQIPSGLLDPLIPDTIQLPLPLTATLTVTEGIELLELVSTPDIDFICPSGAGSSVELSVANSGRVGSFTWSTGSNLDTITASTADQYVVTIVDTFGCEQTDSLELEAIAPDAGTDTTICANQYLALESDGGPSLIWGPSSNVASLADGDGLAYGLTTSTDLVVTADNGFCQVSDTIRVTVDANCAGDCDDCTINKAACAGFIEPGICGSVPDIVGGVPFNESFTFFFPDTIPTSLILDAIDLSGLPIPVNPADILPSINLGVDLIEIDMELPDGLEWTSDQDGGDNFYYPTAFPSETQFGCITICGTTCDLDDASLSLTATFFVQLPAAIPGLGEQIPVPVGIPLNFDFGFIADLQVNASGSTELAVGETVDLSIPSGFTNIEWSTGATSQSITVSNPGTYTVEAEDANGCVQEVEIEVTRLTSLATVNNSATVAIYPNPTNDAFTIAVETNHTGNATLQLHDLSGKIVVNRTISLAAGNNIISDLPADLAQGVYVINIASEHINANKKLIVQ